MHRCGAGGDVGPADGREGSPPPGPPRPDSARSGGRVRGASTGPRLDTPRRRDTRRDGPPGSRGTATAPGLPGRVHGWPGLLERVLVRALRSESARSAHFALLVVPGFRWRVVCDCAAVRGRADLGCSGPMHDGVGHAELSSGHAYLVQPFLGRRSRLGVDPVSGATSDPVARLRRGLRGGLHPHEADRPLYVRRTPSGGRFLRASRGPRSTGLDRAGPRGSALVLARPHVGSRDSRSDGRSSDLLAPGMDERGALRSANEPRGGADDLFGMASAPCPVIRRASRSRATDGRATHRGCISPHPPLCRAVRGVGRCG